MNVVYSFIGTMPSYIVESVKQLRLFYDGPIYLIYSDISEPIKRQLDEFKIVFVPYSTVMSERFNSTFKQSDFSTVVGLKERRQLFMRSYERFYLLDELLKLYSLQYVWFMEVDILMYVSPTEFLPALNSKQCAYSYHREGSFNAGIFYIKDTDSLQPILDTFDTFNGGFRSEMGALYSHFYKERIDTLFPLIYPCAEDSLFWKDYKDFGGYLFDGAILGIYYFGLDPYHTNGKIVTRNTSVYSLKDKFLNIWKYGELEWVQTERGLIPYFNAKNGNRLPIANLHIHSKDLISAVSYRAK